MDAHNIFSKPRRNNDDSVIACAAISISFVITTVISLFLHEKVAVTMLSVVGNAFVFGGAYAAMRLRRKDRCTFKPAMILTAGIAMATLCGFANVPLRVAFKLYEKKFDTLADTLAAGGKLDYPLHIGPFRIIGGGVQKNPWKPDIAVPYLLTPEGYRGEIHGFARNSNDVGFNTWSYTRLNSRWISIDED